MAQAGRTVKHYHTDNGRFAEKGFIREVNGKDQKIIFYGVGAHHQNRIIENKKQNPHNRRTHTLASRQTYVAQHD